VTVLVVAAEVRDALASGGAVVALESTIFSRLGLPEPANRECLDRVTAAIRDEGALPALTAVVDGVARVGCTHRDEERILAATTKIAARDLPVALAARTAVGATTVSATLTLAAAAGIDVFATGGIGGVHRGVGTSHDVSADLDELARRSVVTVCAGAKAFLDLRRTFEVLETLGVPVLGYRTDELPAFWSRSSGVAVPHRVDDPGAVAAVLRAGRALGRAQGVLLAVPIPAGDEIPWSELAPVIEAAEAEATARGAGGPQVTPFVLDAVARATSGRSVRANLALAEHSARIAARVARAIGHIRT
jgi:pseudouridine-5'-phosphate glycosidase